VYVPSLFVAMGLFSGMFGGFALLAAMRKGVITRFRVAPLSRVGLLLGRELMYVVLIGFQALVITSFATIFGLRIPLANLLFALLLLSMMVLLGVSISYALAMLVPNETVLVNLVNGVAQPLSLLAGVLIPLTVAPLWVRNVANFNPFAWGANAIRAVFGGHVGAEVVWQAGIILAVLVVLSMALSSRLFTREVG
jgi:ABC-2 type transport system permease protein